MPDDLKINVRAPGAEETARQLGHVADAEKRVAGEGTKAGAGLKEAARGGEGLRGTFGTILASLGMGFGIGAAVSKIVELVRQWSAHMQEIARLSRDASQSLTVFAMMQDKGTIGERSRQAAKTGAFYGVGPGEAWGTVQTFQSQTGSFEAGMKAAEASWELRRAGVPGGAATSAVSIGMGLGLDAPGAARAVYAAGEASSLSQAEMAQAATMGLPEYQGLGGPLLGYQVMAGLSRVIKEPGQLGTYAAQVARGLGSEDKESRKIWRKVGVAPDADPETKLRALAAAGITTPQALEKIGFTESRQRMGLSVILGDLPGFEATGAKVRDLYGQKGLVGAKWGQAAAEVPTIAYAQALAQEEAGIEAEQLGGPLSGESQWQDLASTRRAAALERAGLGFLQTDKQRADWWSLFPLITIAGAGYAASKGGAGNLRDIFFPSGDSTPQGGSTIIQQGVIFNGSIDDPAAKIPRRRF